MAVTMVDVPGVGESVVTITVHITLNGEELPPEASRLLGDLEALAAAQVKQQIQRGPAAQRTAGAPSQARTLRLVEPADKAAPIRRIGQSDPTAPALLLCTASRMLMREGSPVSLTRREFDLFQFLCENPRRVFNRAQLLRQVWGYDMVGTERTVDVHVRRLRVKLAECARIIATVRGVGYRLDDDAAVQVDVRSD